MLRGDQTAVKFGPGLAAIHAGAEQCANPDAIPPSEFASIPGYRLLDCAIHSIEETAFAKKDCRATGQLFLLPDVASDCCCRGLRIQPIARHTVLAPAASQAIPAFDSCSHFLRVGALLYRSVFPGPHSQRPHPPIDWLVWGRTWRSHPQ
jgi:hypothetical protein